MADGDAVYYYHYDALGSVVALSDSSGDTVQTYEYSVYGQVAAEDPNHTNPYMFTGRRFDIEIGLYYYRARYYDPFTGRFLQTDPIGYGDGMNWYAYCGNSPLNFVDPSGNYEIAISIPVITVWWNASTGDFDTPAQHKADVNAYLTDAGLYYIFPGITLESVEHRGPYYDAVFNVPDDLDISMYIADVDGFNVLALSSSEGGRILLIDERLANLIANKPGGNTPGCGPACQFGLLDWAIAIQGAYGEGLIDGIKLTANGATFDLLPDDLIDRDGLYARYGTWIAGTSEIAGGVATTCLIGAAGVYEHGLITNTRIEVHLYHINAETSKLWAGPHLNGIWPSDIRIYGKTLWHWGIHP